MHDGMLLCQRRKKLPSAATWMGPEIIILSEVSQKQKDEYHMISLTRGIQNMTQMNLTMNQKQTQRQRADLWLLRGEGWGRDGLGAWGQEVKPLYREWVNNMVLLYSSANCVQYTMINHDGKEYFLMCIFICITELLYCIAEIDTTL